MQNNQLSLRICSPETRPASLSIELLVDGKHLAPRSTIDLAELVKSVQTSGEHWIFTCECGTPLCAEITDPILVRHSPEAIEWHFKSLDSLGEGFELDDEEYKLHNISTVFRFDPLEYQRAVEKALSDAKHGLAVSNDISLPCINFTPQGLEGIPSFTDEIR